MKRITGRLTEKNKKWYLVGNLQTPLKRELSFDNNIMLFLYLKRGNVF